MTPVNASSWGIFRSSTRPTGAQPRELHKIIPPKFTLPQRREIKKIAKAKPIEYDLPFSTWSLAKLADFLVAEGVVDDISHEGLRIFNSCPREGGLHRQGPGTALLSRAIAWRWCMR